MLILSPVIYGQEQDSLLVQEILDFQIEQNTHFLSKKTSPLSRKERKKFHGHSFYPVNLDYRVEAEFIRIEREDTIALQTSSGMIKFYRPYAQVRFSINGKPCELTVYQSYWLRGTKEFENYLLLPFRDPTSGTTSYGGGRYLDLMIPDGDSIILNFNLAYNPYCAYTDGYNCTIPPRENTLDIPIEVGLMLPEGH